jgi:polysaccharide deacetylase family protein (PEP-CTERM system associated)
MKNVFLFSVDLEDVRLGLENPDSYLKRVPENTYRFLDWLNKYNFKCTFFTVGNITKIYPSLVKEIVMEGHEIAAHTNNHIPLNKLNKAEFKKDLQENIDALVKSGSNEITGFRAPVFSLIESTKWAYEVLEDLNFKYSSSVLPAKNPLYGWKEFGEKPIKVTENLIELPMTVGNFVHLKIPFAGGVYFRSLPNFMIKNKIKRNNTGFKKKLPLLGYFHPYDIDLLQEKFMHPGINNNKLYNKLMYYNRDKVFFRLDNIIKSGYEILRYDEYVKNINL